MRMHLLAAAAGLAVLTGSSAASAQRAEDAFGTWRHAQNGSLVTLFACGPRLCARIAKVMDGQKTDDKNPNPAYRSRPIEGLLILKAKKTAPNKWSGRLYNREDGKVYSGTITVSSHGSLSLSGCSMGIFCKSATWTRVSN